jgi:hypothetical protein
MKIIVRPLDVENKIEQGAAAAQRNATYDMPR